jgi:asparagine synthetase B (glutamine-hydrolysing)
LDGTNMTERDANQVGLDMSIIDRDVDRLDDGDFVWFAVGASKQLRTKLGVADDPVATGNRLVRDDRDASFGLVDRRDPGAPVLHLWRGLLSPHDWFIARRPNGRIMVSDDFRTTLAALPVSERSVGEDAIIQHYLFRTVFGTQTYIERIGRVGSGEHATIRIDTGERSAEIVDRISSESDLVGPDRYVSVIEDALEGIMADLRSHPGVRLSFSGGVDSTLLATFLGPDHRLLTVVPDTPEFAIETRYARESADLLGMELEELVVSEQSYVDLLEATIDDTARPPVHDVIPFLTAPFPGNHGSVFVIGEGADGIYGTGGRPAKIGNFFRQRHLRATALGLTRVAPKDFRFRAESVIGRGRHLAADPLSADGLAAASQIYGDPSFITDIVGPTRIETILLHDLRYALDRVELVSPSDPFLQQIELRQFRSMFNDHYGVDCDVARTHGVSVVAPFLMSASITALTQIPVSDRYFRGMTGKWMLRDMLRVRLPAYPVEQRKRNTSLPFARFCIDGPLTGIWDRYMPPSIFEGKARRDLIANRLDEAVLWNAIAYAMWDERVVQNPALIPLPSSESISIDLKSPGSTRQLQ